MPPHCDTLDGPVVMAAKKALKTGNVKLILPWVPEKAEDELRNAFKKTLRARKQGKDATRVADYWFFETAVRLHREGEGAAYTGLKPAGLDWGPVVPKAEKDIQKGNSKETVNFIKHVVEEELNKRFKNVMAKKKYNENDVKAARDYVQANLGFVLYAHKLYASITGKEEHGD